MKIEEFKFGAFRIDGRQYLDDIKIFNNKVKYWQTREGHLLKLEDIKDLIESKPEIIIIGTGASGALQISAEIKDEIMNKRIALFIEKTEDACKRFNELILKDKRVAAILHATC
jgi:hypothetical protein